MREKKPKELMYTPSDWRTKPVDIYRASLWFLIYGRCVASARRVRPMRGLYRPDKTPTSKDPLVCKAGRNCRQPRGHPTPCNM